MLNTILESVDTIVIIGATTKSETLSVIGVGLILVPISAGVACALSLANKVLHTTILNNFNKYKKQYEKYSQTILSIDNLYRKTSQDNIIDKSEYEPLCNFFTNYVDDENKNESFL